MAGVLYRGERDENAGRRAIRHIRPDGVDLACRIYPVVRAGRSGILDIALKAHEQAEMRNRRRERPDLVDPVLMSVIDGK